MPNIAITSYCNLHCPYCFANKMIKQEIEKNITLDMFKKILFWVKKDKDKPISLGIIGGEPTLHPEFEEILSIIAKDDMIKKVTLFTNGIYLTNWIYDIPSKMGILLNYNAPQSMTVSQWEQLNNNLDTMSNLGWLTNFGRKGNNSVKVTLGCNLCQEISDYSFFWDAAKKYNVATVRMSVTAPTNEYDKTHKIEYYNKMKNITLDFFKTGKSLEISVHLDCNQIPLCFFNLEEQKIINLASAGEMVNHKLCKPVIDIMPDFTASSCFGTYESVDCNLFKNDDELTNYFLYKQNVPKTLANTEGPCKNCLEHQLIQCQGGCLAFSQDK